MRTSRRTIGALVTVVGMIASLAMFAGAASAATPYTTNASISVNTSNPPEGGQLTISGIDFGPNEEVEIDLLSGAIRLAVVTTDANGSFTTTVTLPDGVTCDHTILSTGRTTGRSATVAITIGSCQDDDGDGGTDGDDGTSGGSTTTGGTLPRTGAIALISIGGIGLTLLGGGLLMTVKRRKTT